MERYYLLDPKITATAHPQMDNPTVHKLWNSFCLTDGELTLQPGDAWSFRIGNAPQITLPDGKEYILSVTEQGICVLGKDYGGLMRGFMSLLMKIEYDGTFRIQTVTEESAYVTENRMIHICIFPENDFYFIQKLIRLAAVCQYTHIIIEFWGMLQYDCLKELSWPHAFTKEQAKMLIRECRELGIEPIPMSNQLGHATASRSIYGKHVVLDQNPRLEYLFTPDGWAWNIRSEAAFQLLAQIRAELYELFGPGEYIHIGCDEAYYITNCDSLRNELPDFLKKLTETVEKEGRKPLMWMDMLLEAGQYPNCCAFGKKDEVDRIRKATAKSTVFVDWQYDYTEVPVPTTLALSGYGHEIMGAPWLDAPNYTAHIETVRQNQLHGIMLTTWHTLKHNMPGILGCAKKMGASSFVWSPCSRLHEETATLLRRLSFEGNAYPDCGWTKEQIEM